MLKDDGSCVSDNKSGYEEVFCSDIAATIVIHIRNYMDITFNVLSVVWWKSLWMGVVQRHLETLVRKLKKFAAWI